MCAAFIQTFKHDHSDYELHAGTRFNIIILETLLMVDMLGRMDDEEPRSVPTADIIQVVEGSMPGLSMTLQARRSWLKLRHSDRTDRRSTIADGSVIVHSDAELETYAPWHRFGARDHMETYLGTSVLSVLLSVSVLLFGVLHRLMTLLARIAPEVGHPNEKLKNLACQAMLQAALSSLQCSVANDNSPTLADCFAYGYVDGLPQTTEHLSSAEFDVLDNEHQIIELFQQSDHSGGLTPLEHYDWSKARHECLSLFRMPALTLEFRQESLEARLGRLRHQHPYEAFEEQLLACLGHLWKLNCGAVTGTPALIQIEQGHLDGLDDSEFEDFMRRVGLREDTEGILKMVKL